MSLVVTLHVFSGRSNPEWILPEAAEAEFHERLARIARTARNSNLKPGSVAGTLGYRGFTVTDRSGLWVVKIYGGVIDPGRQSATLLTEDRELERWLLASGRASVEEGVREHVDRQLAIVTKYDPIFPFPTRLLCPTCVAKDAPVRDAKFWGLSDAQAIVNLNNTYNYANDRVTNTNAQPGKGSGHLFTQKDTCAGAGSVLEAAISDGLVASSNFSDPLSAGQGWYVALVLWPGHDFHFYRQDSLGCWSHKMFEQVVQFTDNPHKLIQDPKTADRGPYTVFCSYMVTKCCLRIR
ncbi:MAG: hypothetical protein JWM43_3471 [Acidobacteriaceae bacterium]|nr:hypothetical protein [Acidobacteriaceae bacterium]